MNVDARYFDLETHAYKAKVIPEGQGEPKGDWILDKTLLRTMEAVVAVHHPDYDGLNGEYFFPMETGRFEKGHPDTYLEREQGRR
jgi:hypothetical protein